MHSSALVNHRINNEAWESEVWFFEEGLAHGDLFIEGGGLGGGNLKALVESHHRSPGKFILSARDEGSIAGFAKDLGDGWVLYSKQSSDRRRVALQRIDHRRSSKLGAVLSFEDSGATIFDYDKCVVMVGDDVSTAARGALASVVAEWQRAGGDPLLVVIGDTAPFDLAGCQGVVNVPADASDDKSLARWLLAALQQSPGAYGAPITVVFSNHAHPIVQSRCLALGARAFFDKSFQMDDLLDFVQATARGG